MTVHRWRAATRIRITPNTVAAAGLAAWTLMFVAVLVILWLGG